MKVTKLKEEGLRKEFKVVLDAKSIDEQMNVRLASLGARAKIPGFRPGHIPVSVLKQRYGQSVMGEVLEASVNQGTQKVIKDNSLRPVLPPKVEIDKDYQEGGDMTFTMVVEVFPEVPEVDFGKMSIDRLTYDIDDKDITEGLERLAERNRQFKKTASATKAKEGNVVLIDFKGMQKGVPFEGGTAEKFHLELGSGQFIPGFEEQLVGVKEGDEKEITVTFPKDYHKKDLAGEAVQFQVKVHEVQEAEVPKLDDDFARSLGVESLAKMKELVKEQLAKEYDQIVRTQLKKQLFDKLDEKVSIEVPPGMLQMEFDSIWGKLQEAKKQGDPSLNKPEAELKKEYTKIAERRVKLGLLLSEIGRINKLQVTQDEIRKAIIDQARMFPGQEQKVIKFYQENPSHVDELRGPLFEEKAVDYVLTKTKFNDKKVSLKELIAIEQEGEEGGETESKKKTSSKKSDDEGEKKPAAKKKSK